MRSFSEWRLEEASDPAWDAMKSSKLKADQTLLSFLRPKVDAIMESIVQRHKGQAETFRDLTPEMRDAYARAIVQLTMEAFFPSSLSSTEIPVGKPSKQSLPMPMPQEDTVAPAASKG